MGFSRFGAEAFKVWNVKAGDFISDKPNKESEGFFCGSETGCDRQMCVNMTFQFPLKVCV